MNVNVNIKSKNIYNKNRLKFTFKNGSFKKGDENLYVIQGSSGQSNALGIYAFHCHL